MCPISIGLVRTIYFVIWWIFVKYKETVIFPWYSFNHIFLLQILCCKCERIATNAFETYTSNLGTVLNSSVFKLFTQMASELERRSLRYIIVVMLCVMVTDACLSIMIIQLRGNSLFDPSPPYLISVLKWSIKCT